MGNNTGKGFGFNSGGGGGGGDTNTNVANDDLNLDATHTTDTAEHTLKFDSDTIEVLKINGTTDKVVIGAASDDYSMPSDRPTTGQVLKATDGSGTIAWSTDTDTNTNIANSNLLADGNHALDVNRNTITFANSTTKIAVINGGDDTLEIGASTPYKMPTSRSGSEGQTLQSSDSGTGTAWRKSGFTIPFTMYIQAATSPGTYYFPEPMSNNKFLAQTRDSGLIAPSGWNIINSTTIRSCTLGTVPIQSNIQYVNFWASVLDNSGTSLPRITVEIWKFTPAEGTTDIITPTLVTGASTETSGDSNNKFYLGRSSSGGVVLGNDLLMPVFKVIAEGEELNVDVWINGSIQGYYNI